MSKVVLVIEDDPAQRRYLERMLSGAGFRVVTAADGEAGIATVVATAPDLIILDVMMPRLNGFQTCRQLKADPATARFPVVILTTKDEPADQFWATEVGADAFLNKPVDFPELLATISRLTGGQ